MTDKAARPMDSTLDEILGEAGIGVWQWNPATGKVTWDAQAERIYGIEPGSFGGTMDAFLSYLHPDDASDVVELITRVGQTGGLYSIEHRILRPDGSVRWIEGQGRIDAGPDGQPIRGHGIVYDITDRTTLERERDELRLREAAAVRATTASRASLDFLIEAIEALSGSLNTERILERLAKTLTKDLADVCVIDLKLDEPVGWITTAVSDATSGQYESDTASPAVMINARRRLELAETGPVPQVDPAPSIRLDTELLQRIELEASLHFLAEPLISRGATIGSVVIGRHEAWAANTQSLLKAIARRAGVALDHAELYRDRSAVAEIFQRSINPGNLPDIPGLEVAVLYRPAAELVKLGGDLYDVYLDNDETCVLAVGDVCGKGVVAAGHAGLARSALRAATHASPTLADAVSVLNRVLLEDATNPLMTAVVATVEQPNADGARKAVICCAGHPPPLVVRADGAVEAVDASGTMLGVVADPAFVDVSVDLYPGDALALFSDGAIETRRGHEFFGTERLGEALQTVVGAPARTMVEAVGATLETWTAETMSDDIVVLLAKVIDVR